MRFLLIAVGLAAPLAAAEPAVDRGHGFFFNKPGATAAQASAALATCRAAADGADSQINAVNVIAGGLGSVLGGVFAGNRLKRVNVENCMLVDGWRLYAMTKAQGAAWKKLSDPARDAELATLVGAETPARGELLRQWRNDYAEPVLWQKN